MGNRTNAKVDFRHVPAFCPRSTALVAMIEAEEAEDFVPGSSVQKLESINNSSAQIPQTKISLQNLDHSSTTHSPCVVRRILSEKSENLSSLIFQIKNRVSKASSPALKVLLNDKDTIAVIDEGSELNCIDAAFATAVGLPVLFSDTSAKAAGNTKINVYGQTKNDVFTKVLLDNGKAELNL